MSKMPEIENRNRFSVMFSRMGAVLSGKKRLKGLSLLAREVSARVLPGTINDQEFMKFGDHEGIRSYLIKRGLLDEKGKVPLKILNSPRRDEFWFACETPKLGGQLADEFYGKVYSKAFKPAVPELAFDFQRGRVGNGEIRIPEDICQAMKAAKVTSMTLKAGDITLQRLNDSIKFALRFLALGKFPKERLVATDFPLIRRGELGGQGGWGSGVIIKKTEAGNYKVFVFGTFSHGAYSPDPIKDLLAYRPQDFE